MTITITAQDGTGDSVPVDRIRAWSTESESGNIVTPLLDGSVAVTLVGDLPRTGDHDLLFSGDASAEQARTLLGRPTTFVLTDTDRPSFTMTFARQGRCSATVHDRLEDLWQFSVGFQEIDA